MKIVPFIVCALVASNAFAAEVIGHAHKEVDLNIPATVDTPPNVIVRKGVDKVADENVEFNPAGTIKPKKRAFAITNDPTSANDTSATRNPAPPSPDLH